MKTLICAVNSKYIHVSLAAWSLKANVTEDCGDVYMYECTINDSIDNVYCNIVEKDVDAIAFSCYIWNIEFVTKIIELLKKANPKIIIITGGPETSYSLPKNHMIDYNICGEGELVFAELLRVLNKNKIPDMNLITKLQNFSIIDDLGMLKSPFTDEFFLNLNNRIVYFESSRGCPFNCSYCISSTFQGIRYFPIEKVKNDIRKIVNYGVRQIKFVDRTFNCNKNRLIELVLFIKEFENEDINFHFEIAPHMIDKDIIEILCSLKPGLIQIEAGIQSIHENTLKEVNRITDLTKTYKNLKKIILNKNIHVHVDLIAGLPYEDYNKFAQSFNWVYSIKAHNFQLGFLKLLDGSSIKDNCEKHGYLYSSFSPYQVISNNYIKADELVSLKRIEHCLDVFYNSGRFFRSIEYLESFYSSAFEMFEDISLTLLNEGFYNRSHSINDIYFFFFNVACRLVKQIDITLLKEYLRFDFISSIRTRKIPEFIKTIEENQNEMKLMSFELLKDESFVSEYLPQYINIPAKEIYKKVFFNKFERNIFYNNGVSKNYQNTVETQQKDILVLFNFKDINPVNNLCDYSVISY